MNCQIIIFFQYIDLKLPANRKHKMLSKCTKKSCKIWIVISCKWSMIFDNVRTYDILSSSSSGPRLFIWLFSSENATIYFLHDVMSSPWHGSQLLPMTILAFVGSLQCTALVSVFLLRWIFKKICPTNRLVGQNCFRKKSSKIT